MDNYLLASRRDSYVIFCQKTQNWRNSTYIREEHYRPHSANYSRWAESICPSTPKSFFKLDIPHSPTRRNHLTDHYARWLESMRPDETNICFGISGPNIIKRIKAYAQFEFHPFLEVVDRKTGEVKTYSLGEDAILRFIGRIEAKRPIDKKQKIDSILIHVVENYAQRFRMEAPEGQIIPLFKRDVVMPTAGTEFIMLYQSGGQPQTDYRGVISKIRQTNRDYDTLYLPKILQPLRVKN